MKVKQINPKVIDYLRAELDTALSAAAQKTGVSIKLGRCTYADTHCTFRLEVAVTDADGQAQTKERDAFIHSAKVYGFEPDDWGRVFKFQGDDWSISGFNLRKKKYPVLCVRLRDGKTYGHTFSGVLKALGREVPQWLR